MTNHGSREFNESIHFHCVTYSNDPSDYGASVYFLSKAEAVDFAEEVRSKFRAVILWERGEFEKYEDVWMAYWWTEFLKESGYGLCEGRGKGWVLDEAVPAKIRNDSTVEYTPLDRNS
ncbi:hypothetical protein VPK21_004354 [Sinorhizobium kummerowiae]|uniref:Uncharacterized protein n=1 Tax=Sinorhizobium kummerowiae TaxID=158892 RepID=A0ABY8T8J6_9HYPH|nr:hypothetical protein [Sinorhizobium kummerowiae]WHS94233.1 hypothetical protein PZL22_001938 [Sinorhizobium kummerowiae]WRW46161.1 hypothetical protein VPK21_004354 [Sinorhizobium kummerowiae]